MDEPFNLFFNLPQTWPNFESWKGKILSRFEAQEWSLKKVGFDKLLKQCFVKVFLVALEKNWDEI
jgi:hypothetical protein